MTDQYTLLDLEDFLPVIPEGWRWKALARCVRIVDGDTVDLFVDKGGHDYSTRRYRMVGIDTAEMHSTNPAERTAAQQAKDFNLDWFRAHPALTIETLKDPDSFGRYLAEVADSYTNEKLNARLVEVGLATIWPTRWHDTHPAPEA